MKIALVYTLAPFIRGGTEILVEDLCHELEIRGHTVDIFNLPFPTDYYGFLIQTLYAHRTLKFDGYDKVICHKFPAYCINHKDKVIWMFHQFRQIYELWNTEYGFKSTPETDAFRSILKTADERFIAEARHIFVNSKEVADRLNYYNHLQASIINPPLLNADNYYLSEADNYIFMPARIGQMKRQHLLVHAMKYVKSDIKLIIAGKSEDASYFNKMSLFIKTNDLSDKVQLIDRYISNEEKQRYISNSIAVAYVPYKEDSCGFTTMEGFYSHKPVITCSDSGGTSEFIQDCISGYIVDSTPESLALAFDKLYNDKANAKQMGENAYKFIIDKNITWNATVERLLK